jgi:hypothetical protein
MFRRISLALVSTVFLSCSPLSAEETSVRLTGIGSLSCAHWRSTRATRAEGIVWIYGFWSGLNYVAAASDQSQSDAGDTAMIAQIEKICVRQPSAALASAAWTAYLELNKR